MRAGERSKRCGTRQASRSWKYGVGGLLFASRVCILYMRFPVPNHVWRDEAHRPQKLVCTWGVTFSASAVCAWCVCVSKSLAIRQPSGQPCSVAVPFRILYGCLRERTSFSSACCLQPLHLVPGCWQGHRGSGARGDGAPPLRQYACLAG